MHLITIVELKVQPMILIPIYIQLLLKLLFKNTNYNEYFLYK